MRILLDTHIFAMVYALPISPGSIAAIDFQL